MTLQTYFLTFTTYGTWLHGDDRGSADRDHHTPGEPYLEADPALRTYRANLMTSPPYRMDEADRAVVLGAMVRHAGIRGWHLLSAHVRTNHVHLVVTADAAPERMLTEFKAYATRALNEVHPEEADRNRWTRHGSTRWLRKEDDILRAHHYTLHEQGQPMAVFPGPSASDNQPETPRAATARERLLSPPVS
jgi:REP element-mobilizing transposase RayT